jgi:hypothetical protein
MNFNFKNARVLFCKIAICAIVLILPAIAQAQNPFKNFENLFTVPKGYTVNYVSEPVKIDGDINKAAWQKAKWSDDFVDIEGDLKPKPALQTNVKMLWDDSTLYIAAQIHDPNVWAYLIHHDDIVFRDNDFEVFIDPYNTTHRYFEMEFNAINTVFDLFLNKPYRNKGNPLSTWDVKGLRSVTKVQGTLNNPNDADKGWTVEMAIPLKTLIVDYHPVPTDGSIWRINFSRVEWDTKVVDGKYIKLKDANSRNLPEHNWVWSPQGVINMHYPERWGYIKFSKTGNDKPFELPYEELQKRYLWLVYYNEQKWFKQHHIYEPSLSKFEISDKIIINGRTNTLTLEATDHQFMAIIKNGQDQISHTINQEGLISILPTTPDE